jgi:hypothetical protein
MNISPKKMSLTPKDSPKDEGKKKPTSLTFYFNSFEYRT